MRAMAGQRPLQTGTSFPPASGTTHVTEHENTTDHFLLTKTWNDKNIFPIFLSSIFLSFFPPARDRWKSVRQDDGREMGCW